MSNMKRHQLIHSGQHPFTCDIWKKHSVRSLIWRDNSL